MSANLGSMVWQVEGDGEIGGSSELIPIFVASAEEPEPNTEEISHIVVSFDEYSSDRETDPKENAQVTQGDIDADDLIPEELAEIDYYLEQDLLTEARHLLNKLAIRAPESPVVNAKLKDLEHLEDWRRTTGFGSKTEPIPLITQDISSKVHSGMSPIELEQLIGDLFRAEIAPGREKSESALRRAIDLAPVVGMQRHLEEVVKKLMDAVRSNEHEVLCYMIVGRHYLDKKRAVSAIECFKRGLHLRGLTEQDRMAFYFELGRTYQWVNNPEEAVYYYEKVKRLNPHYRDVAERLRTLR